MANTMSEKSLIEKVVDFIKVKIFNIASAVNVLASYKEDFDEENKKLATVLGINGMKRFEALSNMNERQYNAYVGGTVKKVVSPRVDYPTQTRTNVGGAGKSIKPKQIEEREDR